MTERNDSSGRTIAELIGDARVNQCAQKISLELAKTISAIDFGRNSPKNEIPPPSSGSPSWLLRLSQNQAWRLKIQWVESPFFEQNLPETSKAPPGSSGSGGGRRVGDPRHGPKRAAGHENMLVTCMHNRPDTLLSHGFEVTWRDWTMNQRDVAIWQPRSGGSKR